MNRYKINMNRLKVICNAFSDISGEYSSEKTRLNELNGESILLYR